MPLRECLRYVDGERHPEGSIDLDRATAIAHSADAAEGFVWIGLVDPTAEELAELQRRFGLSELAVEDALSTHERPKIDFYPETRMLFAVVRTARYDDRAESVRFTELAMFLSERFVITVRPTGDHELIGAQSRAERRPDLLRQGPSAVLWALLDTIVDNYAPVVAGLEQDVDEIEAIVFGGEVAATERIYRLRGQATDFGRTVHPLIVPVDALRRGTYPLVPKPLLPFFRDVSDHLRLVDEEVAAQRDALGSILQANLAVISLQQTEVGVRQNDAVKVLTVISTIFLPLTFITGFFGQNFGWLDDHTHSFPVFAVVGIGSLVVSVFVLWLWFRHTGLVGPDDA